MFLLQPAVYQSSHKSCWVRFTDVHEIAKRAFSIELADAWSDIKEWQKGNGGLLWTKEDEMIMNTNSQNDPEKFDQIYIPAQAAQHFLMQASTGARNVRFNPQKSSHEFKWAAK